MTEIELALMEMILLKSTLYILGGLVLLFSIIPLVRHDYWTFRVFDYPRLQKFLASAVILAGFVWVADYSSYLDLAFMGGLSLNVLFLGRLIYRYTPIAPRQMKSIHQKLADPNDTIRILSANVYQYNRISKKLLKLISISKPDVVLLLETDDWWRNEMKELEASFEECVLEPLDNTYGLLLYSQFPLKDARIHYLVEDDKPSIHAKIQLPSGKMIRFFGIHPAPPGPQHNVYTTERDKELLIVGQMAKKEKLPTIVTGDLNDVAWSYTTELFIRSSGLLDPRRGRGFYNTFHAKHLLLRWPLDHVFCSPEFKLVSLRKLRNFGSDHFPLLAELMLCSNEKTDHEIEAPESEDEEIVSEKLHKENLSLKS